MMLTICDTKGILGAMAAPALSVNWTEVRSVAESGKLLKQVAELFSISEESVRQRARREKWLTHSAVTMAQKRQASLSRIVTQGPSAIEIAAKDPETLRNHHTERTRRILNKIWASVEAAPPSIETMADMEKADKMTRLNEGMTTGDAQPAVQLLFTGGSDLAPVQDAMEVGQVVEDEAIGEWSDGEE